MKKIILVLIGILILSCSKESETKYSTDSEKVFLIITENTTKTELTNIASAFKAEKNITVDFSKTKFKENGEIEHLNLEVDCNDGFKGTATSTGVILKTKNSGFSRDYSENSKVPFVIGAM
ncbi:hypothetical protein [Sediminicola arcticus]|jgi:uncharacterized protein YxeA|uniref:Uncharacterized protein n=1 Tax=Sediminicola arcticus TaxID=1574308 RepID=A0ABV2SWX7_9FLAO|tara:strand:- start:84 stop:446 length:363 start_codon:yes stop_codon:yes gene_type:complete